MSKTSSIYDDINQRKAANEAETGQCLAFSPDKLLKLLIEPHNVVDLFSIDHFRTTKRPLGFYWATAIQCPKSFLFFFAWLR